jgi:hypothetical protein
MISKSNISNVANKTQTDICLHYSAPDLTETSKVLIYGFLMTVMVLTIALNITLIVKINLNPKHKLFTRFFLTSLASVDLGVGLIIMPFNIADGFYDLRHLVGTKTCALFNSMDVMLSTSSILHLGILTYDRYIALCKTLSYGIKCNKKSMKIFFCLNWILVTIMSFGIILPGYHESGIDYIVLNCIYSSANSCVHVFGVYYALITSVISFFLPGVLIICFNIRVFKHVRFQSRYRRNILGIKIRKMIRTGRESQSMRVARTIAVLTGCFFLCWLPFFIVNVISGFIRYKVPFTLEFIVLWLGYCNSAMNPLLYLLLEGKSCIGKS